MSAPTYEPVDRGPGLIYEPEDELREMRVERQQAIRMLRREWERLHGKDERGCITKRTVFNVVYDE